jgi:putative phage-type endonuclease
MVAREDWLARRSYGIGASESAAILGLSPFMSPYALWAKKCGLVEDTEQSEFQKWGNILEPAICEEYAAQTSRRIIDHGRYAVRKSETCPVMLCTLDREVHADNKDGPGCMDAKNVGAYRLDEWKDGAPLYYQVQLQHQMEVTGWRWGSLACLIGGNTFRWCDVERNEAFIELLRRKCVEFWRLVETRTPPEVDGTASTAETLRKLFPKDSGETVALPGEAVHWDHEYAQACEEIAGATQRKDEAKAKLIVALGEATFGVLPSGGRWSYKAQTKAQYVVKESTTRVLRRLAK